MVYSRKVKKYNDAKNSRKRGHCIIRVQDVIRDEMLSKEQVGSSQKAPCYEVDVVVHKDGEAGGGDC